MKFKLFVLLAGSMFLLAVATVVSQAQTANFAAPVSPSRADHGSPEVLNAENPQPGESKRQEAGKAGAGQADQAVCPKLADTEVPVNEVVDARVSGWLDSGHLKPGKDIWLNVAYPIAYPECALNGGAVVYGKVISATSKKDPNSSELTIQFNQADCGGKKKDLKFWLIALVAPPDESNSSHDTMPTEVAGQGRRIADTSAATGGYDARLNLGGTPNTVKPGTVVGYSKVKLEPSGGEGCNARLSSTDRNIHLGTGTEMILTLGRVR